MLKLNISMRIGKKTMPPPMPATVHMTVARKNIKTAAISTEVKEGKRFLCWQEPEVQISSDLQSESLTHGEEKSEMMLKIISN